MSLSSTMSRAWDMLDESLERKQKNFERKLQSDREIAELQTSADIERQRLVNRGRLDVAERQQQGATNRHTVELNLEKRKQAFNETANRRNFTYKKKQDLISNNLKRNRLDLERDKFGFEQEAFKTQFDETTRMNNHNINIDRLKQIRETFSEVYPVEDSLSSQLNGDVPTISRKQKWDLFSTTEAEKQALRRKALEIIRKRQQDRW